MPRIDLAVPFAEKDEAKRLGARWDGERKVWFVPEGVVVGAFGRWLPSEPDIGVRSGSYFIAQVATSCWKCREQTSVFGFILPAGHETLENDEEDDVRNARYRHDEPTIVHYVNEIGFRRSCDAAGPRRAALPAQRASLKRADASANSA